MVNDDGMLTAGVCSAPAGCPVPVGSFSRLVPGSVFGNTVSHFLYGRRLGYTLLCIEA